MNPPCSERRPIGSRIRSQPIEKRHRTCTQQAQSRRQQISEAEQSYAGFLKAAEPVLRQLANALRVEGIAFTLFTPEQSLRLASDRSRVDFIELTLDTDTQPPAVMLRTSCARGSRPSRRAPTQGRRHTRPDLGKKNCSRCCSTRWRHGSNAERRLTPRLTVLFSPRESP
jgi:hypothetical protein